MRAALIIAGSTIKCGMRSKGIWTVVVASVLPMILLYLVLLALPDTLYDAAIQLVAGFHGEDPQEASDLILEGTDEDWNLFVTDATVSGSMKLIGVIGTAIAILFTVLTNEAARRSLQHVLSHPIPRVSVVLGAYLGAMAVTLASIATMTVFAFLLYLAQHQEANWGLFVGAGYYAIGISVTAAYCVLLTTALPSVIGVLFAFFGTWVASQTYNLRVALNNISNAFVDTVGGVWMLVVPRLGDFATRGVDWAILINTKDDAFDWADTGNMVTATILAVVHIAFALGLAGWLLNRKAV